MPSKNDRVELEMKILKARRLDKAAADDLTRERSASPAWDRRHGIPPGAARLRKSSAEYAECRGGVPAFHLELLKAASKMPGDRLDALTSSAEVVCSSQVVLGTLVWYQH